MAVKHFVTLVTFFTFLLAGCAGKKPVTYVPPTGAIEVLDSCVSGLRCDGTWLLTDRDGHLYCKGKLKANLACRGVPGK